jgi:hypothetical protein
MQRLDHSIAYNFLQPIPATLDRDWYIWVPPSTAYDGPKIKYWHPEACTGGCVCVPESGTDGK